VAYFCLSARVRGDALGIGGERRDAARSTCNSWPTVLLRVPSRVHRLGQFLIGHVGKRIGTPTSARDDREPDILVQ